MEMSKTVYLVSACGIAVSLAHAEISTTAWWTDYKAGPDRQGSVEVPAGPATELDWTQDTLQPNSLGGFSVDADGNIYFKTRSSQQDVTIPGSGLRETGFEVTGPPSEWGPNGNTESHATFSRPNNETLGERFVFYSTNNNETVGQTLPNTFSEGETVTFAAWATEGGSPGGDAIFEIGYDSGAGFVLLASQTYATNDSWQQFAGVSHTPAAAAPEIGQQVIVRFGPGDAGADANDIWIDEASVDPFPFSEPVATGFNQVFKLDPADGSVLASSPQLLGSTRDYAGVVIGEDAIWTVTSASDDGTGNPLSTIWKLDPTDLSVIDSFTNPSLFDDSASQGVRGIALGNANSVYVYERGDGSTTSGEIHAIDPDTGAVQFSYEPFLTAQPFFGTIGPIWQDGQGRDLIAYFSRDAISSGSVIRNNGDGTFTEIWGFGGPDNFQWFGSGTLSDDEETIFVTTFNDGDTPSFWAINTVDGTVLDSVPGNRFKISEFNHFGRPSLLGNNIYAGGGFGKIVKYVWDPVEKEINVGWVFGPTALDADTNDEYDAPFNTRDAWASDDDFLNSGEITAIGLAEVTEGENPGIYLYAGMQEQAREDGADPADPLTSQYIVVRDNGVAPELILRTTLNDSLPPTRFGSQAPTILSDGSVIFAGGNVSSTGSNNGAIYKFVVPGGIECLGDANDDTIVNVQDFIAVLLNFGSDGPLGDANSDGVVNVQDFIAVLLNFGTNCI